MPILPSQAQHGKIVNGAGGPGGPDPATEAGRSGSTWPTTPVDRCTRYERVRAETWRTMDPPLRVAPSPNVDTTAPTGAGSQTGGRWAGIPVTGCRGSLETVPTPWACRARVPKNARAMRWFRMVSLLNECSRRIDTGLSLAMATAVGVAPAAPLASGQGRGVATAALEAKTGPPVARGRYSRKKRRVPSATESSSPRRDEHRPRAPPFRRKPRTPEPRRSRR